MYITSLSLKNPHLPASNKALRRSPTLTTPKRLALVFYSASMPSFTPSGRRGKTYCSTLMKSSRPPRANITSPTSLEFGTLNRGLKNLSQRSPLSTLTEKSRHEEPTVRPSQASRRPLGKHGYTPGRRHIRTEGSFRSQ